MRRWQLAWVVLGLAGCTSSDSTHLQDAPAPKYDPDGVARAALAEFDRDHNGFLEPGELAACPALQWGFAAIDTNKDKKLSADEIKARVESYAALTNQSKGTVPVGVIVNFNYNPLPDATVTFVPEACMGGVLKTATAKTSASGHADQFTIDGKNYRGLAAGLYKIQVTKDGAGIPARFNTQTVLGREIFPDPRSGEIMIELSLLSQ